MDRTLLFFIAAASYLLGSVPFSYLIAKRYVKHLDIFGLANIQAIKTWKDAKNYLLLGIILAGDVVKGVLVMVMASRIASDAYFLPNMTFWALVLASAFVVIGHDWPIFYNFKGKKGLASLLGAVLFLNPLIAFFALLIVSGVILVFDYGMGTMGFKKRASRPDSIKAWLKLGFLVLSSQILGRILAISVAMYAIYCFDNQVFWIVLPAAVIVLLKHTNRTKRYLKGIIAYYKTSNVPV